MRNCFFRGNFGNSMMRLLLAALCFGVSGLIGVTVLTTPETTTQDLLGRIIVFCGFGGIGLIGFLIGYRSGLTHNK